MEMFMKMFLRKCIYGNAFLWNSFHGNALEMPFYGDVFHGHAFENALLYAFYENAFMEMHLWKGNAFMEFFMDMHLWKCLYRPGGAYGNAFLEMQSPKGGYIF